MQAYNLGLHLELVQLKLQMKVFVFLVFFMDLVLGGVDHLLIAHGSFVIWNVWKYWLRETPFFLKQKFSSLSPLFNGIPVLTSLC